MTKRKIDPAIIALLRPELPDGLDDAYLESLVEEFERHRAQHARDILGWMREPHGPVSPAHVRKKYLDALLAFRPADMQAVLSGKQYDDEDYGRAASLLLHGHGLGLWVLSDAALEEMRSLAEPDAEPAKPEARPLTWDDLTSPEDKTKELFLAVVRSAIWTAARIRVSRKGLKPSKATLMALQDVFRARDRMNAAILSDDALRKVEAIRDWVAALFVADMSNVIREFLKEGGL